MNETSTPLATDVDADASEPCVFELVDSMGLVELERSSATLDGSIPLRAAQACSPLLDGNRFGFQIKLRDRLRLTRGLMTVRAAFADPIARAHAGNFPRYLAEGLIDSSGEWARKFSRSACRV